MRAARPHAPAPPVPRTGREHDVIVGAAGEGPGHLILVVGAGQEHGETGDLGPQPLAKRQAVVFEAPVHHPYVGLFSDRGREGALASLATTTSKPAPSRSAGTALIPRG